MNRQQESISYEDMTLKEFIQQPDVIQLYIKYSIGLENQIRNKPYVRIGKIVNGEYAIIYVDSNKLGDLSNDLGTAYIESFPDALGLLGRASLEAAAITQVQQQPYLELQGRGVLIGIIDTGIDYTKEAFQYLDGTSKIRYIWDQTIEGNAPTGYLFGSEYSNEQINRALETEYPYNIVPSNDTVRTWYIFGICCSTVVEIQK